MSRHDSVIIESATAFCLPFKTFCSLLCHVHCTILRKPHQSKQLDTMNLLWMEMYGRCTATSKLGVVEISVGICFKYHGKLSVLWAFCRIWPIPITWLDHDWFHNHCWRRQRIISKVFRINFDGDFGQPYWAHTRLCGHDVDDYEMSDSIEIENDNHIKWSTWHNEWAVTCTHTVHTSKLTRRVFICIQMCQWLHTWYTV